MAGSGLFALLDDITTLLDDIATMTKVAALKTSGVTGDDLAVSAEQLNGISAAREIPVVKAVAWGSLKNKAILIPSAMVLSTAAAATGLPLIAPLLMAGGAFLCYEGAEKILHKITPHDASHDAEEHKKMLEAASHGTLVEFEKEKIKGAVRTDLILSGEIMIIALGTMAAAPLLSQLAALTAVGIGMTAFVYGLVGGIVKLDDLGAHLTKTANDVLSNQAENLKNFGIGLTKTPDNFFQQKATHFEGTGVLQKTASLALKTLSIIDPLYGKIARMTGSGIAAVAAPLQHALETVDPTFGKALRKLGQGILWGAPKMMKGLSFIGTAAMFMVGGGIMMHNIPALAEIAHHLHGPAALAVEIGAGLITGALAIGIKKITPAPVKKAIGKALSATGKALGNLIPKRGKKKETAPEIVAPATEPKEESVLTKVTIAAEMNAAASPVPKNAAPTAPSPPPATPRNPH